MLSCSCIPKTTQATIRHVANMVDLYGHGDRAGSDKPAHVLGNTMELDRH
jgi:hypothetical protein